MRGIYQGCPLLHKRFVGGTCQGAITSLGEAIFVICSSIDRFVVITFVKLSKLFVYPKWG